MMDKADYALQVYKDTRSVQSAARAVGVSDHTMIKFLCSKGIYPTETAREVARMQAEGLSVSTIAEMLEISERSVFAYTPLRGLPRWGDRKTKNAIKLRRWRERKKAEE